MRETLHKKLKENKGTGTNSNRYIFRGTISKTGKKHGKSSGATIVLVDVHLKGSSKVIDHAWVNYTPTLAALNEFYTGDIIEFEAGIQEYTKGGANTPAGKQAYKDYKDQKITFDEMREIQESTIQKDFELTRLTKVSFVKRCRLRKGWTRDNTDWMDQVGINRFAKFWTVKHKAYDDGKENTFN